MGFDFNCIEAVYEHGSVGDVALGITAGYRAELPEGKSLHDCFKLYNEIFEKVKVIPYNAVFILAKKGNGEKIRVPYLGIVNSLDQYAINFDDADLFVSPAVRLDRPDAKIIASSYHNNPHQALISCRMSIITPCHKQSLFDCCKPDLAEFKEKAFVEEIKIDDDEQLRKFLEAMEKRFRYDTTRGRHYFLI